MNIFIHICVRVYPFRECCGTGRVTAGNFKDEIKMGELSKDKNTMPFVYNLILEAQGLGSGKTGSFPQLSVS